MQCQFLRIHDRHVFGDWERAPELDTPGLPATPEPSWPVRAWVKRCLRPGCLARKSKFQLLLGLVPPVVNGQSTDCLYLREPILVLCQ